MKLRDEIQAKIDAIRSKKQSDIAAITSVADGKIAALQVFLASGDPLLAQDIDALSIRIDEVEALVRQR